ncbi:MAG: aminotransferase class I/II-fold pyridoxal phosphate-dependent enzyme [Chitinophagales bacterium]|jgi:glycine C-acetyltransferase|nr:aminotransferase class I/II-fold pyridoxal phosphate-dependent enzyme [Chitinophagales bacterium]
MTTDLFAKLRKDLGPIGQHSKMAHGYFAFPRLEGEIGSRMMFKGKERIVWSLNNYLGLANHPEVRATDAKAAADYGFSTPMGARMMSGNSTIIETFEKELASFVHKQDAFLLNFGYQGVVSVIDAIVNRHDVIVYDAESHACILDGVRLHMGKRFVFKHNDMASCEAMLEKAKKITDQTGGGILVITEGVFGMSGNQGNLKGIIELKKKFDFRLMVDDAHGFGMVGPTGAGTGEEQGCQDGVDLYVSTFAKAMASIGAFVAGDEDIIWYLRYNMRSQIFAKTLPMPLVIGNRKRLEMLRTMPELRQKLWKNVKHLQDGLRAIGLNLGTTNTCVTPVFLQGGVAQATQIIYDIREKHNIFCSVVTYPVIPKGQILLRLIPTAAHTEQDIELTLAAFKEVYEKLNSGAYDGDEEAALKKMFEAVQS